MPTLSEQLTWRGLLHQSTLEPSDLDQTGKTVYLGIDPTADSLHVGHLAIMMVLRHMRDAGWNVVLLVGGGTGMIGDPSGKSEERNMLSLEDIARNKAAVKQQVLQLFAGADFEMVDNYDWLKEVGLLEFLRDTGKYFGMSTLVQRDYVAQRIGAGGAGISFTEFSYSLLQGYDFWHLWKTKNVTVQIGGSDQWGNMLSGVDLIRKKEGATCHAVSGPIIMNKATGKKFGKSEDGAVWLDPQKTSPFRFYQFWVTTDDESAIDYLKYFTLLSAQEVEDIARRSAEAPQDRIAQKILANQITSLVHGAASTLAVEQATEVLFGNFDSSRISEAEIAILTGELPMVTASRSDSLYDALVMGGLATSKSDARRLVFEGAVSINGVKVSEDTLANLTLISGHLIVKRGKNKVMLVAIKD